MSARKTPPPMYAVFIESLEMFSEDRIYGSKAWAERRLEKERRDNPQWQFRLVKLVEQREEEA